MIEVKVKETRVVSLCMDKSNYLNDVGNTEENNATMLHFSFPNSLLGVDIKEYDKKVYFKSGEHVSNAAIDENMCIKLGAEQTIYPVLTFQVLCEAKGITWMTFPKTLTLAESIVKKSINSDGKINKITVSERRGLFPQYSNLGTIGEKNATTLLFLLPVALQGYSKNILCENAQGSFNYDVSNDTFDLPSEVLTDNTLALQLVLKDGDKVIWKSIPYTFILNPTLNDSGENVVEKAKSEQKEADRAELGETLSDLTGQDLKEADWNELIDIANELPLKSEQDVLDLRKCSELTYAFAHATTPPSLITGGYKLDKEEPDDPNSPDILIKLPFLETPNAVYTTATRVSANVEECGFSVGEASANTISHDGKSMFNIYAGAVPQNLRKLTLTGVERILDTSFLFYGCSSFEEIELIEGKKIAEKYSDKYYSRKFGGCTNLKSILGTPLDMSRGAFYDDCFRNCRKLRYVRFKPLTISHDLDLSDCPALMKGKYEASSDDPETLLSIVNGVREYNSGMGQITIKLSAFVKDYLTSWRCVKDDETGLYIASTQGMTLATVLTNYKGVIIV